MNTVWGALVAAGLAAGLLMSIWGFIGGTSGRREAAAGVGPPPGSARFGGGLRPTVRLARAIVGFVVVWVLTGWIAAAATTVAAGLVVDRAVEIARLRRHHDTLALALAGWAEILADVMRSHSAIGQAIDETGPYTADAVRPFVTDLAGRAQSGSLTGALGRFADEVDHPTADVLVAALTIAADGRGRNLPEVLDKVSTQARSRTDLLLRVEAGRARIYSEAKAIVAITVAMVAAAIVFGRAYLAPYDGWAGQLVLAVVGALFTAAGLALVQLGRPRELPRPLRTEQPDGSRR